MRRSNGIPLLRGSGLQPTILKALRSFYGAPAPLLSKDPFQLVLFEQVGYLVSDSQRRKAFAALRTTSGLRPQALLNTPGARLTAIARQGGSIAAAARAGRMRRSAELVLDRWGGDLKQVLKLPLAEARRALAAFPMIGEPGADRILAVTGSARLIPLDSNGLRVVQRLGLTPVAADYRRSYQKAREALAPYAPRTAKARAEAYSLLRTHGQELCRRTAPRCGECPLLRSCPTGRHSVHGA